MRNLTSLAATILPKSRVFLSLLACLLLAAVSTSCSETDDFDIFASIYGTVSDYDTGEPISGASVVLSPTNHTKITNSSGQFIFEELDAQQYTITVQKSGYQPNRKIITALSGESIETNITLTKIPQ